MTDNEGEYYLPSSCDYRKELVKMKDQFYTRYSIRKSSPVLNLSEYEKLNILGIGAFGTVVLVRNLVTDKYFAMKILIKERIIQEQQVTHVLYEKQILQSIRFPFLVNLEFSFKDNTLVYFGMPFVNGGEMFTLLRNYRKMTEEMARFYAAQVCLGLEYLHAASLVYRDLKPENILIDHRGFIKITDFGFCKKVDSRTYTLCGTPEYIAPEILKSQGYNKSVDWWSFGILLYELVAGVSPFYTNNSDPMVLFRKIIIGKYKMKPSFSTNFKGLLSNLLQADLSRRFGNLRNGTDDIKNHLWFKPINWIRMYNQVEPPPFVPKVSGPADTSNFDRYPETRFPRSNENQFAKEFEDF